MVRAVAPVALLAFAGLTLFTACEGPNFAPRLNTGSVSDSTLLITVLPDPGSTVNICKNGWRAFYLPAIVDDESDSIRWSFSASELLTVTLAGDTAKVGPVPNQAGDGYVVFTATAGGLSASRTCNIWVFDTFNLVPDSVIITPANGRREVSLTCTYKVTLEDKLQWAVPTFETNYLDTCRLEGPVGSKKLILKAHGTPGVTGIYLSVTDPVNNVTFHHGISVLIQ